MVKVWSVTKQQSFQKSKTNTRDLRPPLRRVIFRSINSCTIPSISYFLNHYVFVTSVSCDFLRYFQALQHDKYRLVEGEVPVITLYESNLSLV